MVIKMNKQNIIERIDMLYDKYEVDKSFYEKMNEDEKIRGVKGILAELDMKKKIPYDSSDIEMIKDIFSLYC